MRGIKFFIVGILLISCQKMNVVRDSIVINNVCVSAYCSGPDFTGLHTIYYIIENKSNKIIQEIEISTAFITNEPISFDTQCFCNIKPNRIYKFESPIQVNELVEIDIRDIRIK